MSSQQSDIYGWQRAEVLSNRRLLFVLWAVKTLFCTTRADFLHHYQLTESELDSVLDRLTVQGFLQQDGENYVLTALGEETVNFLGENKESQFAHPERISTEVEQRFESTIPEAIALLDKPEIGYEGSVNLLSIAELFWQGRERNEGSQEALLVELPCIQQLVGMGWHYLPGDIGAPEVTLRKNFHEVLLEEQLRAVLPEINRDGGEVWLDNARVEQAIADLRRIFTIHSRGLLESNEEATKLLLGGTIVPGTQELHQGRRKQIRYIDFEQPRNNRFLVINQFRVDRADSHYIVPDIVLFVNGIPLAVIECKSPNLTNPIEEGITQLLRYSGQRVPTDEATVVGAPENRDAVPELFYFNQLLISTCFFQAVVGGVGASYEYFQPWKDAYPLKSNELAAEVQSEQPSSQHILVRGTLEPSNLLDLLQNFILFSATGGRKVKLLARYHQFRAVNKALRRLENKRMRKPGEDDQRGGIIWHTQGSGKSLTMVFLVRKMRNTQELLNFKVIFVTDRTDLQEQLRTTLHLADETIETVERMSELGLKLSQAGSKLVFAMIQKYQARRALSYTTSSTEDSYYAGEDEATDEDDEPDTGLTEINTSNNILVIVDEAHRSQARKLHANLKKALPNSARIAFTGTPIIRGHKKKTHEIFGPFIDEYTIKQSELDGATLPILYEGRAAYTKVAEKELLDAKHQDIIGPLPRTLRESLRENYETYREVLEAQDLITLKADDMLLHYATNILPNGFKAMVVAVSRLAAVRYRNALMVARDKLLQRLEQLPPEQRNLPQEQLAHLPADDELRKLILAFPLRQTLAELEFAAVISGDAKDYEDDERLNWSEWTDQQRIRQHIAEFKKPLHHEDPTQRSPLAFLCVRSMLITGFDAPQVQVLYLDRSIKDHELLQAIARVNRVAPNKTNGLVVDYFGIANNLKEALSAYTEHDVQGALVSIKDELPLLLDRHRRLLALFQAHHLSIQDILACVNLLQDIKIRADFEAKLKKFLRSMDAVLPHPQALHYIQDAQQFGLINKAAAATYRDEQLNLHSVGNKVRRLIDEHIDALEIRQLIEPIPITDEHFERKLKRHQSDETNALEMEHVARDYIDYAFKQEDPAYYEQLSERLQEILNKFSDNWRQRVESLEEFIVQAKTPRSLDNTGLEPRTERPFLGILEQEVRGGSRRFNIPFHEREKGRELERDEILQLADLTRQIVQKIREEVQDYDDFWLVAERQERLKKEIAQLLQRQGQRLLEPPDRRTAVADRLVQLGHILTSRLREQ